MIYYQMSSDSHERLANWFFGHRSFTNRHLTFSVFHAFNNTS
jgi:hypothetical protein